MSDPADPGPVPAEAPLSPAELHARYEALQRRVTRFSVVEQQLIEVRDRLDCELVRFGRIQEFSTRALNTASDAQFAAMVADALLDVFELEFALFWPVAAGGRLTAAPAAVAGLREAGIDWEPVAAWLEREAGEAPGDGLGDILSPEQLRQKPGALNWLHVALSCCHDEQGRLQALLLAGNSAAAAEFHDSLQPEQMSSFRVFAQQVTALLRARTSAAIIARQMRQIQESEERLQLAMEGSNTGLWDWDIASSRVVYSAQWKSMLGLAEAEVGHDPDEWLSRVHPDDLAASRQKIKQTFSGESETYENLHRLRHKDGHYVWILAKGRVFRAPDGRLCRFVGTHQDMTQQKLLEARLREAEDQQRTAREQAEAASRAKSVFVANMSHEIRTPMNGVIAMLDLLRESELTDAQQAMAATAEQSATALLDIIGDILDLSKVEAGKIEIEQQAFHLPQMLRDAVGMLRFRADAKDLLLDLNLDPQLAEWVVGDAGRLRQVLVNLIGNAIKFTERGSVTVTVTQPQGDAASVEFEFSVRDSGIGIPAALQSRLFQPFTQADDTATRCHGGTGLGLAISHSLVSLMGGRIWVDSAPGQGAEFRVRLRLPRASAPAPATSAELPDPGERFHGRVLIVDDSKVGQTVARLILEAMGFEADIAQDGGEAVRLALERPYELVLMDCQMPVMDGYEATARIRQGWQATGRGHLPIIALTANVQPSDIAACRASGMDDYIPKPLRKDLFVSVLRRHLHRTGVAPA